MIVRSISDAKLTAFLTDFAFLFERVRLECGEYDLRLRNDYFNLYYKGNSLARVRMTHPPYRIEIHKQFAEGVFDPLRFGQPTVHGKYLWFSVRTPLLPSFLSKSNIKKVASRITALHYSEEITFEQMLITDNLNRSDFVIIDRQVEGGGLQGRMDLLALRHVPVTANQYRFVVVEVKLGNNPELCGDVGKQLDHYVSFMNEHHEDFKQCYERTFAQMRQAGLLPLPNVPAIEIVPPVTGYVVVGGYSGIAEQALQRLQQVWLNVEVTKLFHRLDR